MKYFTQKWYKDTITAEICFQMRKDDRAAKFSEKFYTKLYNSQKAWFVKHLKRVAKHGKVAFDLAAAEAEFEANYQENLDYIRSVLPEEILEKVADVRVLALGVADYDILMTVTRFCGEVNRRCRQVYEDYTEATEAVAEKMGWFKINSLEKLENAPIVSLLPDGNGNCILITSPEITEISCKLSLLGADISTEVHAVQGDVIRHYELLLNGENYEFSMLLEKPDGNLTEFTATVRDLEIEELPIPDNK